MKKLTLLLCLLPTIAFGQSTAIPDANFEQVLINLGYDTGMPDGSVPTANIETVLYLNVDAFGISDLTGIEDFAALIELRCGGNQLTSLDVSQNTALTLLDCPLNQLTGLDISNNPALTWFECGANQLTSLDISNNSALTEFYCVDNQITCLNVKNGNNTNMITFAALYNPNLTCIEVDDATWATANWTVAGANIDASASFSEDCDYPINCGSGTTGIPEPPTKLKDLLYITDILGRTTYPAPNRLLFYIYDDGSVEKEIQLER